MQQKENAPNTQYKKPRSKKSAPPAEQSRIDAPKKKAPKDGAPKKQPRIPGAKKQAPKNDGVPSRRKPLSFQKHPFKLTFIGGLNEIGKNCTVYEYGDSAIIVDCGMTFPDDDMLGIDMVIPDFSYLEGIKDKLRGVLLTHGHEDHIGALPYFLRQLNIPIYGTELTLGLVEYKLREHNLIAGAKLNTVHPGDVVTLGEFTVEFINVNHSIPASVALAIKTAAGTIVQTGDFKIDMTPIHGDIIDLGRFGELGSEGVLCLLSDSTNAERPGYTSSERTVGESFNKLFQSASATDRRIIIATFASNVYRIQQIIDCAARFGRKVAVSGRSMVNTVAIGQQLGYLNIPDGLMVDISLINRYPKNQMVLITTGSQGEPMSALTRMAFGENRHVTVGSDDFIIISANPIPGNEKTVGNVVNQLLRQGCEVVYEKMYDVHVSGHACQEELKIILGLTKPKYFIPVHGEQKHLLKHAGLATSMGMGEKEVLIADLGDSVEISDAGLRVIGKVSSGRVLIDGLGVGDVGSVVLRDRKHLGQDGLIVAAVVIDGMTGELVSMPNVVSRGFVYVRDAEPLMDEAREVVRDVLEGFNGRRCRDIGGLKVAIRDALSRMMFERTRRSPMILPIIMEI